MKHQLLSFCLCCLLGVGISLRGVAQGQNPDFSWVGNDISTVADASDPDMKTVYLYNVATGKYLNVGSFWGTCVSAYNVGMRVSIHASTDPGYTDHYKMIGPLTTPEGNYIAFGRRKDTANDSVFNFNRVYCDRGKEVAGEINGILNWKFTETATGSKTYTISCYNDEFTYGMGGTRYLAVEIPLHPNEQNRWDIVYPSNLSAANMKGEWKIITLKDLKDAFKEQYASSEDPADATFLVADQHFDRSHTQIGKWETTGLTKNIDEQFRFPTDATSTFYVGIGMKQSLNYMAWYGNNWVATVRNLGNNTTANGTIIQKVNVLKQGWYRVSCDGFYKAQAGSGLKSYLVAKATAGTGSQSDVSVELNSFNDQFSYDMNTLTKDYKDSPKSDKSPYVLSSELFEEDEYNNSVLVYVPSAGGELQIGIKVEGSSKTLDLTVFDNFQLQYCGNNDIILDEAQTNISYITHQVDPLTANTLILKRTMTPGLWNSIMLPVSLTAAQFRTAFGDQSKLARLKGQSAVKHGRIDFESVDLSVASDIVLKANQLYIMKPMRAGSVTSGSYSRVITTGNTITVNAPYYVINNVTITTAPTAIVKETAKTTTTTDGAIQFCGTHIAQTSAIVPAKSYVLGANDGLWYYTANPNPIRGFRCWIATNAAAGSPAPSMVFYVDGAMEGNVTGIDLPTAGGETTSNADVYDLSGRLVRQGSTTDGLSRGIYIVNGQKMIVR